MRKAYSISQLITTRSVAIREKADKTDEIILVGSRNGTRFALKGLGVKWFVGNSGGKVDLEIGR